LIGKFTPKIGLPLGVCKLQGNVRLSTFEKFLCAHTRIEGTMKDYIVSNAVCPSKHEARPSVLLVMPDAFHLGWRGSTRRILCVAGAFRALGFEVVLIAGKMTNREVQTAIDQDFPGMVIRTYHAGAYPGILDCSVLTRRGWRMLWKARGAEYYSATLSYGWASVLDVEWLLGTLVRYSIRPALVWGICGGRLEGAAASARLAERIHIPWVFELHDPPIGCGLGYNRTAICGEFERLLRISARQVVISESYRRKLIADFSLLPTNIDTIPITYEGGVLQLGCNKGGEFWSMVYAGSLDGSRSIKPLIRALAKAFALAPMAMKATTRLNLIGHGSGFVDARRCSKELGLQGNVMLHGSLAGSATIKLIERANALVALVTEDAVYQIPGKLYELMRTGKPIIALMPDCEARDILMQSGVGFVHHCDDSIDAIAMTLVKLWNDWLLGRASGKLDENYIKQFSSDHLPQKLQIILNGLNIQA